MSSLPINMSILAATEDAPKEADLIKVIKDKTSSRKEKADACRLLNRIGGKDAVEPLGELLLDPEMSHMARYGLEAIPDDSVDEALRHALNRADRLVLVGIIGSIGVRKDKKAVQDLKRHLDSSNDEVVKATARTLGSIGTEEACDVLMSKLDTVSEENRLAICEGLFRCAEGLADAGNKDAAREIYSTLQNVGERRFVSVGALQASEALGE